MMGYGNLTAPDTKMVWDKIMNQTPKFVSHGCGYTVGSQNGKDKEVGRDTERGEEKKMTK